MLVGDLSACVRDVLDRVRADGSNPDGERAFAQLLAVLNPHANVGVDDFLAALAKVKKPRAPKKSPEEVAREKEEQASLKAEMRLAKAKAAADKKAEKQLAKAKAAADKKAEKEQARAKAAADKQAAKDLAKAKAADDKKAKAEAAALAKAAAKLQAADDKKAKKAAEAQAKLDAADVAVRALIDDMKALMMRFRGGNVPQTAVDEHLDKLKPLSGPQLFQVAHALNADATLTEKSPKAKILKQTAEMVRRVWKMSDNVNN